MKSPISRRNKHERERKRRLSRHMKPRWTCAMGLRTWERGWEHERDVRSHVPGGKNILWHFKAKFRYILAVQNRTLADSARGVGAGVGGGREGGGEKDARCCCCGRCKLLSLLCPVLRLRFCLRPIQLRHLPKYRWVVLAVSSYSSAPNLMCFCGVFRQLWCFIVVGSTTWSADAMFAALVMVSCSPAFTLPVSFLSPFAVLFLVLLRRFSWFSVSSSLPFPHACLVSPSSSSTSAFSSGSRFLYVIFNLILLVLSLLFRLSYTSVYSCFLRYGNISIEIFQPCIPFFL